MNFCVLTDPSPRCAVCGHAGQVFDYDGLCPRCAGRRRGLPLCVECGDVLDEPRMAVETPAGQAHFECAAVASW